MKHSVIAAVAALIVIPARAQSTADFSAVDAKLNACSAQNPNNYGVSNCNVAANAEAF